VNHRGSAEWGRVCRGRARWLWTQGRQEEGARLAEECLALAHQHDEAEDLLAAYILLALVFHSSGEWRRGLELEIQQVGAAADAGDSTLSLLFDVHL
jgi:hypothetical protein